jgi:hypothetical protein
MLSTLSFTLDVTQKKGYFTDTTDYSTLPQSLSYLNATGSVAVYFQGDLIGSPLTIDLGGGDTTTPLFDLELDANGDIANGSYSAVYTLNFAFNATTSCNGTSLAIEITAPPQIVNSITLFEPGVEITVPTILPSGGLIVSRNLFAGVLSILVDSPTAFGSQTSRLVTLSQNTGSFSWVYSGCTQTTADVEFTYDCEFGNSGSWAVSNTTVLAATEFITSQVCTINYPSWTNVNPIFNPQVVTTSLPYPTILGEDTPLATGTYSVLLSQQIQQNQASGLIITYSNSITREFTVTCAGTLCGLIPCIENLRAAHATELIRNRISKYQVFVDNVLLYYTEAMNYRACGELDSYKSTIALLQAQLDASGCDCACCDNETYYWVSNNSANSIIDELLANFQYRLFDTGIGDPGSTQAGVELGAIWQNTNTAVLYRCTIATPGGLVWQVYYDPSDIVNASEVVATATAPLTSLDVQGQLDEIATNAIFGATNGLTELSGNVELGGTLNKNTTIARGAFNLILSGSTGNVSVTGSDASPSLSVTNTAAQAFSTQGTHSSGSATLTTLDTSGSAVTASPTLTLGGLAFAPGNGYGTSIEFTANGVSGFPTGGAMSTIKSTWTNATTLSSKLELTTMNADVESTALTLNADGQATLDNYGSGTYTGTAAHSLSVDSSGNVIETAAAPKVYAAKITKTNPVTYVLTPAINTTGGTLTLTYSGASTSYVLTSSNGAFTTGKTFVFCTLTVTENGAFGVFEGSPTQLILQTVSTAFPAGYDGLENAYIKIEIYP